AFGCSKSKTSAGDGSVPSALRVEPSDVELTVTDSAAATIDFKVIAIMNDGSELDVSSLAAWRIDDDRLGSFVSSSQFSAPGPRGGQGVIEVDYAGLSARASIRVIVQTSKSVANAPVDANTAFNVPAVPHPSNAFAFSYPSDHAMVPKNLVPMEIQFDAPG